MAPTEVGVECQSIGVGIERLIETRDSSRVPAPGPSAKPPDPATRRACGHS